MAVPLQLQVDGPTIEIGVWSLHGDVPNWLSALRPVFRIQGLLTSHGGNSLVEARVIPDKLTYNLLLYAVTQSATSIETEPIGLKFILITSSCFTHARACKIFWLAFPIAQYLHVFWTKPYPKLGLQKDSFRLQNGKPCSKRQTVHKFVAFRSNKLN
ncbi:MAG: hypothetical protein GY820_36540 [Gammaproteobacteria bacterium]|nr:hypothetical protein [Gammaproteobacteria bacterium]